MRQEVRLKKEFGWNKEKISNYTLIYKGYFNNSNIKDILNFFIKYSNHIIKIRNYLSQLDGLFTLVYLYQNKIFVASDRINSIPILIYRKKNISTLEITDHFAGLKLSNIAMLTPDNFQSKHFAMSGYTFQEGTFYKEIIRSSPGSFFHIENNTIKRIKYFKWMPYREKKYVSYSHLKDELKDINNKIIEKLIENSNDKCLVIPLSSGLDSRFVLSGLLNKGYKNLITFSYGRKKNREMQIARKIAKKANVRWHPVIYSNKSNNEIFNTEKYKAFVEYSDNLGAVHFVQDYSALKYLEDNRIIPSDSIIVNGQTGDFISGNHIVEIINNKNFYNVAEKFLDKHYKIWNILKNENGPFIKKSLKIRFNKLRLNSSYNNILEFFESVEFEDRQSKYVMNGQRTYDFLGYEWRLPLWDKLYLEFWEKVEVKYKLKQKLYKETLIEQNWFDLWKDFEINPQPDKLYSYKLKLLRFCLKLFFFPFGKKSWHAFERKYLDYFISELCSYAQFSYLDIIKDKRSFSGPTSWYIEKYLRNKNINWKGEFETKK